MAEPTPVTIRLRGGRTINHEYYGPKADKDHQTWTAKSSEEISLARTLVGASVAEEVEPKKAKPDKD